MREQQVSRRPYRMTRRQLLGTTGAAALGLIVTACGGSSATPTAPAQTTTSATTTAATTAATTSVATTTMAATTAATTTAGAAASPATPRPASGVQATPGRQASAAVPTSFKEAPALADQAKAGKLPPVAQRLPKAPLVVQPVEQVGKYGGTWRLLLVGGADLASMTLSIGYEHLVRWNLDWSEVLPNVAESYEVNQAGDQFTFKLREGMKWSDGQPFTADDIVFWWEDVVLNKELSPGGAPTIMQAGDKPATVEKVDSSTVRVTFATPNGLFLQLLCTADGAAPTQYPKHYLQQFHKKYADPAKLDQLMKENNAADWVKLFQLKGAGIPGTPYDARWYNPDLPTLHGWKVTTPYTGSGTRVVAERNPYYWKVDPSGQQLPYVDQVTYDVVQDDQVALLKTLNGELDMYWTHVNTLQNKPVLDDNQQKGQYHLFETLTNFQNDMVIALNQTHKDPVKRQVFQNKDFRIGLSYAINRQEVIDTVYVGQGQPWQASPRPESPFPNQELATQYTAYDIQKANAALDKAFPKKDGQGFRLGPDGKRISFAVEVAGSANPTWADAMKLIVVYWQKVGVDAQVKNEDRSLLYSRKGANEHDAVVWTGPGGLRDGILDPRDYFPYSHESNFAPAWSAWFNPSALPQTKAEEPPAATKKQMDLYNQLKATVDPDRQVELFKQILDIAKEEFYLIGTDLPVNGYAIVKNNFKNVPEKTAAAWLFQYPAVTNPCQYYFQ